MNGEGGADVYKFISLSDSGNTVALADVINGWNSSEDNIDLSAIDANLGTAGDQSFGVAGDSATTVAHSVTWHENAGNTEVSIDTNAVVGAEMMFVLTGINLGLTAANFNP